jgi:GNAT superfamily N-acetyltransferase
MEIKHRQATPLHSEPASEAPESLHPIFDGMREANLVTLRTHVPGDIGKIISRHGALYAEEFGWDITFESLVARIGADFIDNYDPALERCWIAEDQSGGFLGCVVLVKDKEVDAAKLRLLLVEPCARGMGVGKKLVGQCVDFAREADTRGLCFGRRACWYLQEGYTRRQGSSW